MADNRVDRRWWSAIAGLTAVAFALRLVGMAESPAGDELIFHWYVDGRPFGSMWSLLLAQEKTPPLGFVLGWLSARIGPADPWMRLPSLLAGTALVPTVAMLARRCAGNATGTIAAAFVAASPFLLFYGVEARSYSLAALLSCASLVALLAASDRGGKARWALWSLLAAAAVMSHYTAVFVVVAGAAWALLARPDSRRQLALGALASLALVAWWIPSLLTQWGHAGSEARRIGNLAPLSLSTLSDISTRALIGHPLKSSLQTTPTGLIPGRPALIMILAGLALAGIALAVGWSRERRRPARPRAETLLLAACALATPVGLVMLSLEPGKTLLLPRNLICSVPPFAALLALAISRLRSPLALASTVLISGGLMIGSIRELDRYGRPPMGAAAEAVAKRWRPGDVILEANYFREPPLDQDLAIHLGGEQRRSLELSSLVALRPFEEPRQPGSSIFTVVPIYGYTVEALGPPSSRKGDWRLVWQQRWPGLPPVIAAQWVRVRTGGR